MIVVAVKDKGKLIKGCKYTVDYIRNDGTNQYNDGKIRVTGFHLLPVELFTLEDGSPIPKINYSEYRATDPSTIRKNDLLICKSDRYKNFVQGEMYRVEEVKSVAGSSRYRNWTDYFIKFEGYNRYIKYNSYSFSKVPTDKSRDLALNAILNDEVIDTKVDTSVRKLDKMNNKDAALIKLLSKSIIDPKRKMDPVNWACSKMRTTLSVTKTDYDKFMDMSLKEILEIVKQD